MDIPSTTVIKARTLIDGTGGPPLERPIVVVEDGKITAVGQQGKVQPPQQAGVRDLEFPEGHLLPGLIDVHTHLMFGTVGEHGYRDGPYESVIERDTDEIMLLRAAHNTHIHLSAGVTTLRDCGARNRITFDLREGARQGLVTAPRLLLSGRPVTITGGHFFWCNGEADGEDGVRNAVRQLVKEGSDFIKIMASGGGTAITDNRKHSYGVGELRAIVEEAHVHGKLTTAHCLATQSMINALDAGVDMMEHGGFIEHGGSYVFRPEIAERIAQQGMYVSPTVQTGYRGREALLERSWHCQLSSVEKRQLEALQAKCESQLEFLGRLWSEWDIKIVAGTDAIQTFGDYCLGLELQSQAGMSNMEVIQSATSVAARAIGMDNKIGTVEAGKAADLVIVEQNPLEDISALRTMTMVMREGRVIIPYRSMEE